MKAFSIFASGFCASGAVSHATEGRWAFATILFLLAAINGIFAHMNGILSHD
jgi:hypothetical protein